MPLKLSHFVYSSLNGYRPVYVSPDLPREFVSPLEALAKGVYLTAQRTDLYLWLRPPGTDDICVVKGLRNGTDRAGRSRSCVHAVLFSASDAAGSWFFSPLSLPERVFVTPDSSLQSLPNELLVEADVTPSSNLKPPEHLSRGTVASLLALMLNPETNALILDSRGDAVAALRSMMWLVPPPARRHITVAAWTSTPAVETLGSARLTVLAPKSESLKTMPKPPVILEYPEGKVTEEDNDSLDDDDAAFNVYAEYVASNLGSDRGFERIKKLAGLLERHPPQLELTQERYRHILEGFGRVEHCIEEYGSFRILDDVRSSLIAVKEFALGGQPSLALDILDTVVSFAVDHYDMDAESMKNALGKLRTNVEPGDRRFFEACRFLADQLLAVAASFDNASGG